FQNGDEDALRAMIADPYVIVGGSDGGAHVAFICQTAYSSHLLGYWVRQKHALSLEAAVRRLTFEPALLLGVRDRGLVREGLAADLVVFDPDRVAGGGPTSRSRRRTTTSSRRRERRRSTPRSARWSSRSASTRGSRGSSISASATRAGGSCTSWGRRRGWRCPGSPWSAATLTRRLTERSGRSPSASVRRKSST